MWEKTKHIKNLEAVVFLHSFCPFLNISYSHKFNLSLTPKHFGSNRITVPTRLSYLLPSLGQNFQKNCARAFGCFLARSSAGLQAPQTTAAGGRVTEAGIRAAGMPRKEGHAHLRSQIAVCSIA